MTSIRLALSHKMLRIGGIAAIACTAALALSGCFSTVGSTYVQSGNLFTIKRSYSDALAINWAWACGTQDLNGNGIPGGEQDRGWCALRLIRKVACEKMSGVQANLCNAAAADQEWDDFNPALTSIYGHQRCIAVDVNPFVDNRYNWTTRDLGSGGCVH